MLILILPFPLAPMQARQRLRARGPFLSPGVRDTVIYGLCGFVLPSVVSYRSSLALSLWPSHTKLICCMWMLHYARRFYEVLLVHKRSPPSNVATYVEVVLGSVYYSGFASLIAWSLSPNLPSLPLGSMGVCIPALFFAIGEIGNFFHHRLLAGLKRPAAGGYAMPSGFLFDYVSCPHYFFETLSWASFAFCCMTGSSFLFAAASFQAMNALARDKHDFYLRQFDGKEGRPLYPSRKRMIPFIY